MEDSTLIANYLGTTRRYIVATPGYLKGHEKIVNPNNLKSHDCVILQGLNNETDWDLESSRKKVRVHVRGKISCRDFQSASQFVYKGHGIGLLPAYYCEEKIKSGALVRILPEWSSQENRIHAVYPTRKFLPSRLLVFLEEIKKWKSPLWQNPGR